MIDPKYAYGGGQDNLPENNYSREMFCTPTRCERRCFRGLAASTGEKLFSLDFGFHFLANAPGWSVVVMVVTIIRSNVNLRFAKEVKREPGLSLKLRDPDAIVALRLPMAITIS